MKYSHGTLTDGLGFLAAGHENSFAFFVHFLIYEIKAAKIVLLGVCLQSEACSIPSFQLGEMHHGLVSCEMMTRSWTIKKIKYSSASKSFCRYRNQTPFSHAVKAIVQSLFPPKSSAGMESRSPPNTP